MKAGYTALCFAVLAIASVHAAHNADDDDFYAGPGHCGYWKCKKCEGECRDNADCKGGLNCYIRSYVYDLENGDGSRGGGYDPGLAWYATTILVETDAENAK
eukprot:gene6736-26659_t